MDDLIVSEFTDGVNAYWSGECPDNWNSDEARAKSPYLQGWYMASMWETQPGWLVDFDGTPMQEDD